MTLRLRFNLLITLIMLFLLIALTLVTMSSSKRSIQEGVESANKVTLQYLETIIVRSVQNPEWGSTHDVIRRFLRQLGYVRSNDIYLYNQQGELTYKSSPSSYLLEVMPPKWYVNYISPKKESNSRLIDSGRLIVQTNASGAIRGAWVDLRAIFFTTCIFFILFNLFVYWLLGQWLRPINNMLIAIERIGKGGLDARLPHFNVPEFRSIATNLNAMGNSLQKTMVENNRLGLIAEQTADAVMIHDENLKITFWNTSAQRIFGYTKKDIIGKPAQIIVPKNLLKEFEENLDLIKGSNFLQNFETKRRLKNGGLIDVSISASPLIDPRSKKVIGDIVSMRDITEKLVAEKSRLELKENRKLTAIIQEHVEDERKSLARELHDELGQYVSAIKIFAQNIANRSKGKDKDIEVSASSVTSAANQIYDGMHNIIRQLRPSSLDDLGLTETLNDIASKWSHQYPNINLRLNIKGDIDSMGEVININIYRIIQEAMNNTLKHSQADKVEIDLKTIKNKLIIKFDDNGIGFDTDILSKTKQFGIVGIKERVNYLNGTFSLKSLKKKGTSLMVEIPLG